MDTPFKKSSFNNNKNNGNLLDDALFIDSCFFSNSKTLLRDDANSINKFFEQINLLLNIHFAFAFK